MANLARNAKKKLNTIEARIPIDYNLGNRLSNTVEYGLPEKPGQVFIRDVPLEEVLGCRVCEHAPEILSKLRNKLRDLPVEFAQVVESYLEEKLSDYLISALPTLLQKRPSVLQGDLISSDLRFTADLRITISYDLEFDEDWASEETPIAISFELRKPGTEKVVYSKAEYPLEFFHCRDYVLMGLSDVAMPIVEGQVC
jgi:hypothetical protein